MSDAFDPYHRWLGIAPKDQPPNHYRLLGIDLFENSADVIESAADRQISHVRTFQAGYYARQAELVLNALATAKVCLLNPQLKLAYDHNLQSRSSERQAPPARTTDSQARGVPPALKIPPPLSARAPEVPPPVPDLPRAGGNRLPLVGIVVGVSGLMLFLLSIAGWFVVSQMRAPLPVAVARNPGVEERPKSSPPRPNDKTTPLQPQITPRPSRVDTRPTVVQPAPKVVAPPVATNTTTPAVVQPPPKKAAPVPAPAPVPVPVQAAKIIPAVSPFVEEPEDEPNVSPLTTSGNNRQPVAGTNSSASSEAMPAALKDIRSGLTHWWGLHEPNGTRRDSVGLKDLIEQGQLKTGPGLIGTNATFSRRNYLRAESDPSLQIGGSMTISMWVRFSTFNSSRSILGRQAILGKWGQPHDKHDYVIGYHYDQVQPRRFEFLVWDVGKNSGVTVHSSLSPAEVNTWYFVVCQYDADRRTIGMSINDGAFDLVNVGPIETSNNPLFVGADHGPPWNSLTGDLGLIGMWNRLLTSAEITALYNNGAGVDVGALSPSR